MSKKVAVIPASTAALARTLVPYPLLLLNNSKRVYLKISIRHCMEIFLFKQKFCNIIHFCSYLFMSTQNNILFL